MPALDTSSVAMYFTQTLINLWVNHSRRSSPNQHPMRTVTCSAPFHPRALLLFRRPGGILSGWMEKLRRLWERRFDRLENYLRKLQQKERPNGRKK